MGLAEFNPCQPCCKKPVVLPTYPCSILIVDGPGTFIDNAGAYLYTANSSNGGMARSPARVDVLGVNNNIQPPIALSNYDLIIINATEYPGGSGGWDNNMLSGLSTTKLQSWLALPNKRLVLSAVGNYSNVVPNWPNNLYAINDILYSLNTGMSISPTGVYSNNNYPVYEMCCPLRWLAGNSYLTSGCNYIYSGGIYFPVIGGQDILSPGGSGFVISYMISYPNPYGPGYNFNNAPYTITVPSDSYVKPIRWAAYSEVGQSEVVVFGDGLASTLVPFPAFNGCMGQNLYDTLPGGAPRNCAVHLKEPLSPPEPQFPSTLTAYTIIPSGGGVCPSLAFSMLLGNQSAGQYYANESFSWVGADTGLALMYYTDASGNANYNVPPYYCGGGLNIVAFAIGFDSHTGQTTISSTIYPAIYSYGGNYNSPPPIFMPAYYGSIVLPSGTTLSRPIDYTFTSTYHAPACTLQDSCIGQENGSISWRVYEGTIPDQIFLNQTNLTLPCNEGTSILALRIGDLTKPASAQVTFNDMGAIGGTGVFPDNDYIKPTPYPIVFFPGCGIARQGISIATVPPGTDAYNEFGGINSPFNSWDYDTKNNLGKQFSVSLSAPVGASIANPSQCTVTLDLLGVACACTTARLPKTLHAHFTNMQLAQGGDNGWLALNNQSIVLQACGNVLGGSAGVQWFGQWILNHTTYLGLIFSMPRAGTLNVVSSNCANITPSNSSPYITSIYSGYTIWGGGSVLSYSYTPIDVQFSFGVNYEDWNYNVYPQFTCNLEITA